MLAIGSCKSENIALNVVNAKYEPRVSGVLSMRVVDHVVVLVDVSENKANWNFPPTRPFSWVFIVCFKFSSG